MWDIAKVMWRRWYVVVPLLLAVLAATLGASAFIKPEYTSAASVLLVPPADRPEAPKPGEKANPWLDVGPVAMAQAVSIAVQSKASRDKVAAEGIEAAYEVGVLPRSSIVLIEVSGASQQQVRSAATRVIGLITDEVASRQAAYKPKPGHQITAQVLDPGDNLVTSNTGLRRGQAMIMFAGLLLTAGFAVVIDALLRQRRRPEPSVGTAPVPDGPLPGRWQPGPDSDATITFPAVGAAPGGGYDPARRTR
ncbi:MAG: Wzz/FepE/Etk N-terminal domain-containing protein [Micromonosporaceae bacterium]